MQAARAAASPPETLVLPEICESAPPVPTGAQLQSVIKKQTLYSAPHDHERTWMRREAWVCRVRGC